MQTGPLLFILSGLGGFAVGAVLIIQAKPSSLDCWLRDNYARNSDTKQAVNEGLMI